MIVVDKYSSRDCQAWTSDRSWQQCLGGNVTTRQVLQPPSSWLAGRARCDQCLSFSRSIRQTISQTDGVSTQLSVGPAGCMCRYRCSCTMKYWGLHAACRSVSQVVPTNWNGLSHGCSDCPPCAEQLSFDSIQLTESQGYWCAMCGAERSAALCACWRSGRHAMSVEI